MQMTLFAEAERQCDPREAPPGYYAIPKAVANPPGVTANLCRQCDWRPDCDGSKYRCMPYELANGLKRNDGVSVVFKQLPPNA